MQTLEKIAFSHITELSKDVAPDIIENWLIPSVKEWIQQKPLELNYLTEKETEMSDEMINLQVVLGLQSCKTKGAVSKLLDDIRVCERKRLLGALIDAS